MHWTYDNNTDNKDNKDNKDNRMINYQNNDSIQHTQDTFKVLVDAIIPRTPRLAKVYHEIMFFGALDFLIDEFMILSLNSYYISLANSTAELLDIAAERLLYIEGKERLFFDTRYPKGGTFAALSPSNRFRALILLEEMNIYFEDLPMTFREHPELILYITSALNRLTMMGYYSEWFGYGSTRLMTPNQRILEFSPLSWRQVGYPGPSFSYRAQVIEYYERRAEHE